MPYIKEIGTGISGKALLIFYVLPLCILLGLSIFFLSGSEEAFHFVPLGEATIKLQTLNGLVDYYVDEQFLRKYKEYVWLGEVGEVIYSQMRNSSHNPFLQLEIVIEEAFLKKSSANCKKEKDWFDHLGMASLNARNMDIKEFYEGKITIFQFRWCRLYDDYLQRKQESTNRTLPSAP